MQKRPGTKNTDRSFSRCAKLVVLGLFLFAASCTTITPVTTTPPETIASRISLEEALLLRNVLEGVDTLRGTVRITMDAGGETAPQSIAGYLALRTPDALRFTYIGPFGIVLFEAVANNDVLTLYLPQQMIAYTGAADSHDGAAGDADLPDMPFADLFDAFTTNDDGCVFFLEHRERETILYGISSDTDEFGTSWDIAEKVVIDRETMRLVSRELFTDGVPVSRTTYEDFQETEDLLIPTAIVIEDLIRNQTMSITLSGMTANEALTGEVFETTPDDPWTIMPLDQFIPPTF